MELNAITGKIRKTVVVALAGAALFAAGQGVAQAAGQSGPETCGSSCTATVAAGLMDDPWHPSPAPAPAGVPEDDPWHPAPVTASGQADDPWHPGLATASGPEDDPWHPVSGA
ncbi:hypothetical protein ACFV1C_12865 [Streptomyces sp. NPDC059605]|uniref:hypothetical protein n=1 Tax=unclassified Streptomyces TaxID=2593676 RepID=UPI00339ED3AC